ncbi:MAG: serine protease [Candidatus Pacebacteria bacterium]|nr:serine protease [Candidatus Paceibacterota bacterium]
MENLSKQQIVLLTLLVSFVTSIATGIVTVALMNQAPVGVTQTINRVVERTIEKVVPSTPTKETQTIVKETIVVNVDDQVTNAIEKNSKSIVRIYTTEDDYFYNTESIKFIGVGVVISDDNIIATDNNISISNSGKYFIKTEDGKNRELTILRTVSGEEVALLKIKEDSKNPITLPKVSLISNGNLKLGQSVVYIGGESKNMIGTGIISAINTKEVKDQKNASSTINTVITSIETTILSKDLISGGLLLNLSGELVGIKTTYLNDFRTDLFAPSNYIEETLLDFTESQKKN